MWIIFRYSSDTLVIVASTNMIFLTRNYSPMTSSKTDQQTKNLKGQLQMTHCTNLRFTTSLKTSKRSTISNNCRHVIVSVSQNYIIKAITSTIFLYVLERVQIICICDNCKSVTVHTALVIRGLEYFSRKKYPRIARETCILYWRQFINVRFLRTMLVKYIILLRPSKRFKTGFITFIKSSK